MNIIRNINVYIKKLLQNTTFLLVLSVLVAFSLWLWVVTFIDTKVDVTVRDVPVAINVETSGAGGLGLDTILDEEVQVDVEINGDRTVVGSIDADDIRIEAVLSDVTGAGVWELRLEGYDYRIKGFDIVTLNPSTINVRFDYILSKTLQVEPLISGLSLPEGYIMSDVLVTPTELMVTGPAAELSTVDTAAVTISLEDPLTDVTTVNGEISLFDRNLMVVENELLSTDVSNVLVTIPVLKKKTVSVDAEFENHPESFSATSLNDIISPNTIEIVGSSSSVDAIERLSVGPIDMTKLQPGMEFEFELSFLLGTRPMDEEVTTATVTIPEEGYSSKIFNVETVMFDSVPNGFEVELVDEFVPEVLVYGPEDILENLEAEDLFGEVDLFTLETEEGQMSVPVSIQIDGVNSCWVFGEYTATIDITEIVEAS